MLHLRTYSRIFHDLISSSKTFTLRSLRECDERLKKLEENFILFGRLLASSLDACLDDLQMSDPSIYIVS